MKYFLYTGLILFTLAVNLEITGLFAEAFFHVNLLLILCTLSAMEKRHYDFLFFAMASGLILDIYSPQSFGSFSFSFLLVVWIVNWVVRNFLVYEINIKVSILLLCFSYVLSEGLLWVCGMLFNFNNGIYHNNLGLVYILVYQLIGVLVYLLFSIPMYFLWQKVTWVVKKLDIQAIS